MGPVLYFGVHSLFLSVWHVFYDSAFGFLTMGGKNVRAGCLFRQAQQPLLTACGRMAKSAKCCSPRPSRCFAKRAMGQCALHTQGTIAFCLNTLRKTVLFSSFFLFVLLFAHAVVCSMFPVFLALMLPPSASVCCCHLDSLTRWRLAYAQEAARVAFLRLVSCSVEPRCAL